MEDHRSRQQYGSDYRSRSFDGDYGGMDIVVANRAGQIQPYQPPPPPLPQNHHYYQQQQQQQMQPYGYVVDNGNGNGGGGGGYYYKPPSKPKSSKYWGLNDPEVKRRKRVASYKVYTVEGKVKGSFRKGFRWLKDKYSEIVYGWW